MDDKTVRLAKDTLEVFGKLEELYEVTTFIGYRNGNEVTVRILDQGPSCSPPDNRFMCSVKQDDGKEAGGNNARTVDEAIAIVHWGKLD